MNSAARRLPKVMVPVLSSSSVSMSPAVSTALPDMARTLRCTMRSMPAMPMAESSPPIVVGMRQTSSATSAVVVTSPSTYSANGRIVPTASRKMIVKVASRMLSAISFGVFWREAPSTRAIILSRNVSPGLAEMRMRSQSLVTVVPPVTELRMSVPGSFRTGADSPVMAASLTYATPSMTSPSPGMSSPASTRTMSPVRRSDEETSSIRPSRSRLAIVSRFMARRVLAWALPRPSAIASAKLAKSTVNQSQTATAPVKNLGSLRLPNSSSRNM